MKVFLWLLAMAVALGTLVWLLPPREIEKRLPKTEQPTPTLFTDRVSGPKPGSGPICPTWGPCWRDGRPIEGAL